jgi:diguanylate cyclase (GGDEF)-like protein/PAS domain S-box-containing protein
MTPFSPTGSEVPPTPNVFEGAPVPMTAAMNASLLVGLRASQEVAAVFEHASLGIALTRDRVIIRHNRVFGQTLGYPPNGLVGKPALLLFPSPDDYASFGELAGPVLSSGQPFRGERAFVRQDGSVTVCVVSASAVDPLRPEWGTIWIFDDVTTERQQQVALKDALMRIEAIMKNAPLGIILTTDRRITDSNAHFEVMFGYAPGEAVGLPASELLPDADAYAELARYVGPRLSAAQPVEVELRMRRRSGEVFWTQLVGYVRDVTQPQNGTIWLITDRSEPRRQAQALEQALAENQAIFDRAALGMVVLINRGIVRCNPQMEVMFGYPPGSMRGMSTRSWYPDDATFHWVGRHLQQGLSEAGAVTHELPLQRADGSLFWARMTGRQLGDSSTLAGGSLWLLEDITTRRQTESELRAVTALNQTVFESASVAIIATDTDGIIQLFNAAAQRMLGYGAEEVLGRHTPALLHLAEEVAAHAAVLSASLGRTVEPGFGVFVAMADLHGKDEREWTYVRKDGTRFPVTLSVTPLRRPTGEVSGYLGLATDITERKQAQLLIERSQADLEARVRERTHELALANAQLQAEMAERDQMARQMRTMAHFDAITGLPNRNLLHDRLAQALLSAQRHRNLAAVMFLDLDRFKNINDTLGHSVGDALLEQVARRLSMAVRASDTLARIGGDEFVLLLPHVSGREQAARVAEKLLSVLDTQLDVAGHSLQVSTSIGVCLFPEDGEYADVLLRNADTAMYQAKASGRNTYRFFTDQMNQDANQRYRIESSLRQGVREQELRLMYQPLVDTQTHQMFGVEVLVRWQSSVLGLVAPAQFIPIAEESDLIVEIDSWVLKTACEQAARWRSEGQPQISLAVNLSARQFRRKDLVAFVAGVLADTGHPPHLLELEITESSLMHNVSDVIDTLDQLVRLGVRLAIDDFGTGYSSLAYLKRFPVHKLKVDQSFVRDIGETHSDLGIVKTVIALAHTLQLDLLAEGVETHAQLDTLRALGCERFQGFLFAHPLNATDLEPLFGSNVTQLMSTALAA